MTDSENHFTDLLKSIAKKVPLDTNVEHILNGLDRVDALLIQAGVEERVDGCRLPYSGAEQITAESWRDNL